MKNNRFISTFFGLGLLLILSFQVIEQFNDLMIDEDQIELFELDSETESEEKEFECIYCAYILKVIVEGGFSDISLSLTEYFDVHLKTTSPPPEL